MKKNFFSLICLLLIICCPSLSFANTTYKGMDISEWVGTVDFEKVKDAGIEIVYIRAAYGDDYVDHELASHYSGAHAAGLKIGFYHYITAVSEYEAKEQAAFFYSLIKDKEMACAPVMDYETFDGISNEEINRVATTYMETLEELSGMRPILYSDASNAATLWDSSLTKYPLWVADYGVTQPQSTGPWSSWVGFQYSDTGSVPGIDGNVDLDYYTSGVFLPETTHQTSPDTSTPDATTPDTTTPDTTAPDTTTPDTTTPGTTTPDTTKPDTTTPDTTTPDTTTPDATTPDATTPDATTPDATTPDTTTPDTSTSGNGATVAIALLVLLVLLLCMLPRLIGKG